MMPKYIPTETPALIPPVIHDTISPRQRALLLVVRQALIMILGALEDYLDMDRSIIPKHRRNA